MFIKELYRKMGVEICVHNLITDYTLPDGRRAHKAYQILSNQVKATDSDLIAAVVQQLPKGSRICMVTEIEGDIELSDLSKMAESVEFLAVNKRVVYLDRELAQEYVGEMKRGENNGL